MDTNITSGDGSEEPSIDFESIKTAYEKVWTECPYTSFAMFDYLVKNLCQNYVVDSWESFFKSKRATLDLVGLQAADVTSPAPDYLWQGNSGLCTSFAIRVLNQAGQRNLFVVGSTGGHRAAWRLKQDKAILVDSSARRAIFFHDVAKRESEISYLKPLDGSSKSTTYEREPHLKGSLKNGPGSLR
ncbi:hypothetical protein MMC07_006695 [Pseudocyphellaria aurata]|nr:hypothetical protein [Pseudocyphellaria aurata]